MSTSAAKKNDLVLQQLLAENQRLKQELESSKNAIKTSEAIKTLIDYVNKTTEPFDKNKFQGVNEFTKSKGMLNFCERKSHH